MSTNLCHPDSTHLLATLGRLQCPYEVGDQAMCSFNQRENFCPFSHRSDHNCNPSTTIPAYICVDHLVGKCKAESTWKVPITDDWLIRCSAGFHPCWILMMDLEQLNQMVEDAQQDQVQVDDDLKCAICLRQMNSPFGLLEHCRHVFCAECIVAWQKTDRQKRCPVCRVTSRRVLLWPNTEPIQNEQAKLQLFGLQARCIDLFHRGNQRGADQQDQVKVNDDQKCAICSQRMHSPFGLLERCCHVFCAECIVVWQESDPQMRCPTCRVASRRVLLWPDIDPIRNKPYKLKLFRLQARCNNLFHGGNQVGVVAQDQEDVMN